MEALDRKRDCAKLTIPYLLPEIGRTLGDPLYKPYSSDGSRGAKALAAKLVLALFPPQRAFFELRFDEAALTVAEQYDPNIRDTVDNLLRPNTSTIMHEFDGAKVRSSITTMLLYLITTGDALALWESLDKPMRVLRPDSWVTRRTGDGTVVELLIRERVNLESIPEKVRPQIEVRMSEQSDHDNIEVYTRVQKEDGKYTSVQECEGIRFNEGSFPEWKKGPFIGPLRWQKVDGEAYGIGHAEDNLGTLRTVEGLAKLIVQGASAVAKVNWLVDPSTGLHPKDLTTAANGAVLVANLGGTTPVQAITSGQKVNDFQVALSALQTERGNLRAAFLMTEAIQRDAERVTAEEIRMLGQELENALGGVYTMLAEDFQTAILDRLIELIRREKPGALPSTQIDGIDIQLLTGLRALGAGHDMNALQQFMMAASAVPNAAQYLNTGAILTDMAKHQGVAGNVVLSQDQVQQMQQMQRQQELLSSAAPGVSTEIAKGYVQANLPQGEQPQ